LTLLQGGASKTSDHHQSIKKMEKNEFMSTSDNSFLNLVLYFYPKFTFNIFRSIRIHQVLHVIYLLGDYHSSLGNYHSSLGNVCLVFFGLICSTLSFFVGELSVCVIFFGLTCSTLSFFVGELSVCLVFFGLICSTDGTVTSCGTSQHQQQKICPCG
jgi:hypothetical protein